MDPDPDPEPEPDPEPDPDPDTSSEPKGKKSKQQFHWPRIGELFTDSKTGTQWKFDRINKQNVFAEMIDGGNVGTREYKNIERDHRGEPKKAGDTFKKGGNTWKILNVNGRHKGRTVSEGVHQVRYRIVPVGQKDPKMKMYIDAPPNPGKPLSKRNDPKVELKKPDKWWHFPVAEQLGNLIGGVLGLVEGLFSEDSEAALGAAAGITTTAVTGNPALGAAVGGAVTAGAKGDTGEAASKSFEAATIATSEPDEDPDEDDGEGDEDSSLGTFSSGDFSVSF